MLEVIAYADMLAIPFFAVGFVYFYTKHRKTRVENALCVFSLVGLVLDTSFSIIFLRDKVASK